MPMAQVPVLPLPADVYQHLGVSILVWQQRNTL